MRLKLWLPILLFSALFSNKAWAVVVAISSGTSEGSIITITDSSNGLGTDPNGHKPLLWANFENGSLNPTSLGQVTSWSSNDNMVLVGSAPAYAGSQNAVKFTWDDAANRQSGGFGYNTTVSTVVQYGNRYFTADPEKDGQKHYRINRGGGYDYVMAYAGGGAGSYNECAQYDFYHGYSLPSGQWLDQWFLYDHGSNYSASFGTAGNGKFTFLQNGTTQQYLTDRNNCDLDLTELRFFDNFADSGFVDGSHIYMKNFFATKSYWRVTISSDNFRNQYPVITNWWALDGSSVSGRMHIGKMSAGSTVKVRVWGGQNQVLAEATVTAGIGQTPLSPSLSNVTSSAMDASWTSFSTNYTKVLDDNSDFSSPVSSVTEANASKSYSGLSSSTQYFFQVKIATEADTAYASNQTNATTSSSGGGSSPASSIGGIRGPGKIGGGGGSFGVGR